MSIFVNEESPVETPVMTNEGNGDTSSELATLRRRLEALEKRNQDKDAFIEQLKAENAEQRRDLANTRTLEELHQKSTLRSASNNPTTGSEREVEKGRVEITNTASVDPQNVQLLVREALAMELSNAATKSNLNTTKNELRKVWGDNYVAKLESKIEELGIGKEFLDDIAGRSPKAVFSLLGINTSEAPAIVTNSNAPPSSRRTTTVLLDDKSFGNGVRNKAYYDRLKELDPVSYRSPKVQNQRHKDAIALGSKFFET